MIKIFDANDRDFSTAGNIIINPTKCIEYKNKSLNGWYIEVEMPIKYKEYIEKDKLCVIKTKSKLNPQAFRISENIKYTNKKISFIAEHVMFDARNYFLLDVRPTNLNGINALNYINERTDNISPFSMFSNVENINTAYFIRKTLLEAWEVIEERWNGVFDADNWNINFMQQIGNDNGETITYGKNMQSMEIYEDWSNVVTKLYPVGYDGIMLPEVYIESDVQYEVPYTKKIEFETKLEDDEQTEENLIEELRENAEAYIEENKYPKVCYTTISNINDNMEIGDTIQVLHPLVSIFTEVLQYEYNVISKKIRSLTFGNYTRDVKVKFDNIKNSINQINETLSKQEVVIKNQTDLINSLNKTGIVYIDENEILILDRLPKESAQNVWRWGLGGLGFSSNGYEGPFETAITMDGQINANFITTGTMSASRIEGLSSELSIIVSKITRLEDTSISKVDVEYALGTSTTTAPTTGWSTIAPQWEQGKYMWQRTVTTYADSTTQIPHKTISEPTCIAGAKGDTGSQGQQGNPGQDGDDGIGVSAVVEEYYLSTSNTTQTGGSWKTTQDTWVAGKYIWTRSKITWTDNTTTYTTPILATGLNNANTVANNANNKVDNLDIGGRNYALGTSTAKVLTGTNVNNQSVILYDLSLTVAQINAVASGKLICSFDMTLSDNLTGTSGTPSISVGQGDSPWQRVVVTEIQAGTYHKEISLSNRAWTKNRLGMRCNYIDTGVKVTISNLKVEIANKYTDWTPAPEDMTTNEQLSTVIREQSSDFQLELDSAKTEVQSSTTGAIMTLLNNGYLTAEQVNALVNGNAEDIVTIKEQLTQTITNSEMQIAIQTAINGGVSYLKNTLFTINDEGLWIATSQDEFNAQYNNQGMYLYSFDEMIAKFDVDGSTIQGNLNLDGELITPNLRMMNTDVNGVPHVHIHWIGG